MKAVIWHNPGCGTSRKTLAILEETAGIDLMVIRYLDHPYSRSEIAELITTAGLTPREALRLRGTDAEGRGLPDASDDAILDAMAANPAYVNRPFVRTDKGARLCRPQELVYGLL
ncbi:MAG: arsenate reductase family protein [Sphingopyxis sp.]